MVGNHRNAIVEVDLEAIRYNVKSEVQRLASGTELFMVVKANGYGHGAIEVARAAQQVGATGFCVAILDEALELRAAGFTEPILVLGVTRIEDIALIAEQGISVTVPSIEWLSDAIATIKSISSQNPLPLLKIHLGLDTGMGRIGLQTEEEVVTAAKLISDNQILIDFEGVFTHFSCADETSDDYFNLQYKRFNRLVYKLPKRPRYVHISNSATSLWHAKCNGNMIRFGVAGYGLNPSGRTIQQTPYPLHPALSVFSEIVFCKKIVKGRSVSYGATYTANEDQYIATIPVGYADGIPRRLQNFKVLIDGEFCSIVGRVCMDQLMVRVPKPLPVGTRVTFVGHDGDKEISLQDVADYCDTIHYELACQLTARMPRRYTHSL